ncbi:hypothetical protein OG735_39785 [Streptomyces sp. NBC_01210]|uniref:VMAP-C domain-containing protein n=1 Tax=Streptomyces sp. NBC_01210 TaxID=2903774 RepID=UPI002E1423F9|nr:hypothetical protein OG735_39785 [Streptomyces sp. NBC_01210]
MRLAEALLGFPDSADAEFRHTVLKEMGAQLNQDRRPLDIRQSAVAPDHILQLARFCEDHHDPEAALRALWTTMEFLRRDEAALLDLKRCIDWLTRRGRLPERQLARLEELCDRIAPSVPRAVMEQAVQTACGPGRRAPLRGRESLPEAVRRLDQARGNDRVPLVLLFLAELAARLPDRVSDELREEIGNAAGLLGLQDEEKLALSARTRQPAPSSRMVLQLRVEEVSAPAGSEQYVIEAHLYDRDDAGLRLLTKRECKGRLGRRELAAGGANLLVTWNDLVATGDHADDFRIEFLLPWSLLGHPADMWGVDADGYRVGFQCPVVVRSLDRLREPSWRRPWRDRWKLLHNGTAAAQVLTRCGWLAIDDPEPGAPEPLAGLKGGGPVLRLRGKDGDVRRWLDTHADIACLGLAFAYEPTDERAVHGVKDAVREGVPAIIWRRDGGDPGPLISRLGELATEDLPSLPELLRRWRRSAQEDDIADMHNHLTLLWDDPDCIDVSQARSFAAPVWTANEQEQEQ